MARPFQFRLRTLFWLTAAAAMLGLVVLCGIGLSIYGTPPRQEPERPYCTPMTPPDHPDDRQGENPYKAPQTKEGCAKPRWRFGEVAAISPATHC